MWSLSRLHVAEQQATVLQLTKGNDQRIRSPA